MNTDVVLHSPAYSWSPIIERERLIWPDDAAIAVVMLVTLERMEWYPPAGGLTPPTLRRFHPGVYPGLPDVHNTSVYEYGNRVGVFRVLDELTRAAIPATIAADARVLDECGALVDYALARGAEFIGHGIAGNRFVTAAMSAEEEQASISASVESIVRATGARPVGWHNPEYSASTRTLDLLCDHEIRYVVDWPTDEQPHPIGTARPPLVNLPVVLELDDVLAHVEHAITAAQLAAASIGQFRRLRADGEVNGRLFLMNVHPWLTGQPHRIRHFRRLLEAIRESSGVWAATGRDVADWYQRSPMLDARLPRADGTDGPGRGVGSWDLQSTDE